MSKHCLFAWGTDEQDISDNKMLIKSTISHHHFNINFQDNGNVLGFVFMVGRLLGGLVSYSLNCRRWPLNLLF